MRTRRCSSQTPHANFVVSVLVDLQPGGQARPGSGAFIDSVLDSADGFYSAVLGSLRAWSAAPPKLRPGHPTAPEVDSEADAALISADYSSQDEPSPQHVGDGETDERSVWSAGLTAAVSSGSEEGIESTT